MISFDFEKLNKKTSVEDDSSDAPPEPPMPDDVKEEFSKDEDKDTSDKEEENKDSEDSEDNDIEEKEEEDSSKESSDEDKPVDPEDHGKEKKNDLPGRRELEYVCYARILNFAVFKRASHAEKHEQWQVDIAKGGQNGGGGKLRVRMTTDKNGENTYSVALKTKALKGDFESQSRVTKQFFMQMALIADKGMKKHRYTFPIDNTDLKWEIDVYPDHKGGYYPWIRLELEVKEELSKLPELPFEVEEFISPDDAATEEGKKKVNDLFNMYFLIPNKYAVKEGKVTSALDKDFSTNIKEKESTEKDTLKEDEEDEDKEE